MSPNRRIILNTLATYGRSVVGVCLGLFSARWVLEALGQSDFGLYGVVGGMLFFVTFVTAVLAGAVSRFYAYSIGHGSTISSTDATDDLSRWFNTAFSIHLVLPVLLFAIGYPFGVYAVKNWLVMPSERLGACIWVLRISLVTAFVSMITVPYISMYTAKQLITELALWGLIQVLALFLGAFFLLTASGDRLICYALMTMTISCSISIAQTIRAYCRFPVCRLSMRKMFDTTRLKQLFAYTGWSFLGGLGFVIRGQGVAWLVNVLFGPQFNASYSVGNQVSAQTASFSSALVNALSPAVTANEGAGERGRLIKLVLNGSKFGGLLVLLFGLPLIVEIDNVLDLWLRTPPPAAAGFCVAMVVTFILRQCTMGHMSAIHATGKIGATQTFDAIGMMSVILIAYIFFRLDFGFASIGYAFVVAELICCAGRLYYAQKLVAVPIRSFLYDILPRLLVLTILILAVDFQCRLFCQPGLIRLCSTSLISVTATISLGWILVLSKSERAYFLQKFHR